jgi:hypothetical protein
MFRKFVSFPVFSFIALLSVAAWADDAAPVTQGDLKKLFDRLDKLELQLQSVKAPAPPIVAPTEPSPSNASSGPSAAAKPAEMAANTNADVAAQLARLEQRVKVLENAADNQESLNVQLAEWVNGRRGVAAMGAKPAVDPPKSGMLAIRNDMATSQDVVVNGGVMLRVQPRSVTNVPVPVGSITTQIRGEAALTWFVGAPSYSQEIIIAPASRNPLSPPLNTAIVW